jgi:alkylation response protein AidB-like acyl-CoA dehydrogenase
MELIPDGGERAARDLARKLADEVDWQRMCELREETRELAVEREALTFYRALAEAGAIGLGWPKPWGEGLGATEMFSFHEELEALGMPGYGLTQNEGIGSMLLRSASPAMIEEHLPGIRDGTRRYVQGLSEPDAGSDLLAVRTRALREGEEYVINGEKLWTSSAQIADYISTLVVTDPEAKRGRGLTVLLVPTSSPGLDIKPVWLMGGWHVNSCHFDDVRVPVTARVGEENDGWRVLARRLDDERAMSFGGNEARLLLARLIDLVGRGAVVLDDGQLEELGGLVVDAEADRLHYLRVAAMSARGEDTSGVAPLNKLSGSLLAQRVAQFVVDATAPESCYGDGASPLAADAEEALRVTTVLTIMGGTSEVQRNTAAVRGLGLPRSR